VDPARWLFPGYPARGGADRCQKTLPPVKLTGNSQNFIAFLIDEE